MPAKRHRIIRGDDFRQIVRAGNRVGGAYCITHEVLHTQQGEEGVELSPAPARFGFIVSKAVGNAVTRNLVRRRLKTVVDRRLADGFSGVDVVFRVLPSAAGAPFEQLQSEVNRSLDRIESLRKGVRA